MGSLAAVYSPVVFVDSSRVKPFSGLETATLAPGITAPEVSVTVPTIVAVFCAQAERQQNRADPTNRCNLFTTLLKVAARRLSGEDIRPKVPASQGRRFPGSRCRAAAARNRPGLSPRFGCQ